MRRGIGRGPAGQRGEREGTRWDAVGYRAGGATYRVNAASRAGGAGVPTGTGAARVRAGGARREPRSGGYGCGWGLRAMVAGCAQYGWGCGG
ncbi:hypothetical protein GCM10023324_28980 [Streptomyces youssoufiensis]